MPNRFNFHEQPEALVKRLSEINPAMEKAAGGRGSKPPAAILSHYLKRQQFGSIMQGESRMPLPTPSSTTSRLVNSWNVKSTDLAMFLGRRNLICGGNWELYSICCLPLIQLLKFTPRPDLSLLGKP